MESCKGQVDESGRRIIPSTETDGKVGTLFGGIPGIKGFEFYDTNTQIPATHGDRRLPVVRQVSASVEAPQDSLTGRLASGPSQAAGWDHIQHLGEFLVC